MTCGVTTGYDVRLDLRFLFAKHQSILGSFMGELGELHQVLKFIFQGKLKAVIDQFRDSHFPDDNRTTEPVAAPPHTIEKCGVGFS